MLERVRAFQRVGNFVAAFDLATIELEDQPESLDLKYAAVLALASCGATETAQAYYQSYGLSESANVDHQALGARIAKDRAWNANALGSSTMLLEAAQRYERIYAKSGGSYPGVNAATLFAILGEDGIAIELAERVMRMVNPTCSACDYWQAATLAECALILNREDIFDAALVSASNLAQSDLWARSRTRIQLNRLSAKRPALAPRVREWTVPPLGIVFGSDLDVLTFDLARSAAVCAPARVIWPLPGRDPEVRLPIPDVSAEAIELMVTGRVSRECLSSEGSSVSSLMLDDTLGSEEQRQRHCLRTALGLAINQCMSLETPLTTGIVRSGAVHWINTISIDSLESISKGANFADAVPRGFESAGEAHCVAILFADLAGYSKFDTSETHYYWRHVMPRVSEILAEFEESVWLRKTWGDAIHLVGSSAATLAKIGVMLARVAEQSWTDTSQRRRPEYRIALHYGPLERGFDPVEQAPTFYGQQLSLAARLEPITPPGGIYVTEPFAAQLGLEGCHAMHCAHIGTVQLAKGYGPSRVLSLSRR